MSSHCDLTVTSTAGGVTAADGVTLLAALGHVSIYGDDTICFDIAGPGPHTIRPTESFPGIFQLLTLDGTTQMGFSGRSLITIDFSDVRQQMRLGTWNTMQFLAIELAAVGDIAIGYEPAGLLSEQLLIYQLNRARHDPMGYQRETGIDVDLSRIDPRPPLAVNDQLAASARFHSDEMATHNYYDHQSQVTGEWPNKEARDHGYPLAPWLVDNDNNIESITASRGSAGSALASWINSSGHRSHLMGVFSFFAGHREIGVGHTYNAESSYMHYWTAHTGFDPIGNDQLDPTSAPFLTGVTFLDRDGDTRYDLNEGLGGVTLTSGSQSTTTNTAGGWSLPITRGIHTVTAAGAGFVGAATATVAVAQDNVEVDFISGQANGIVNFGDTASEPSAQLLVLETALDTTVAETTPASDGGDTYDLFLAAQPSGDVIVTIQPDNQIRVTPLTLTFTPGNWQNTQTVTVTAVNDSVGEELFHAATVGHTMTSGDPRYNGLVGPTLDVQVLDNDRGLPDPDLNADLSVTSESGPNVIATGRQWTHRITVTNHGPDQASNVELTGSLPAGTSLVAVQTAQGECTVANTVTCSLGTLTPQAQTIVTFILEIATEPGPLVHTIQIAARETDINAANNRVDAQATVVSDDTDPIAPTVAQVHLVLLRVGNKSQVTGVVLQFSEDMGGELAENPFHFGLTQLGKGRKPPKPIELRSIAYDAAAWTATLTPTRPLPVGKFFRLIVRRTLSDRAGNPLDGNRDGTAGDDFVRSVAIGNKLKYADGNGDAVSIAVRGGWVQIVRRDDGEAEQLRLIDVVANGSVLSGMVRRSATGDALTHVASLAVPDGVGFQSTLPASFRIGPVAQDVFDALMDASAGSLAAVLVR